ncbi:isoform 3 of dynactin subunit 2 [Acrodontium crateriforme]|uniref:Isoform 3 of dynactin subunit 2 n=1 Tax=Acrodontium crateriforme TaxID=150365 RepID=A0AAQ3RBE8_9PEZI|nr:isoform 3 of dynactin subunit 2 [Acrodontium crateriforme]
METSEPRRLAALPGYDTSPDIYETPDYPTNTETTIQTSPRSASRASDTSVEDDGDGDSDSEYGISRRRLYPARARSRFGAASRGVNVKGVDLSDRVDGKRKGFRVLRKPGDDGDDEEEEGLEARIARLRREIEECRIEAEKERETIGEAGEGGVIEELGSLGRLLAAVEVHPASTVQAHRSHTEADTPEAPSASDDPISDEQTLQKVTTFDSRLAALEQALGISSLDAATNEAVATPVLPSLSLLDQQLSALTAASSLAGLDAASSRIAKLRREAADLAASSQRGAVNMPSGGYGATNGIGDDSTASDEESHAASISSDDLQKLQALYALLPSLQSLAPTVPAILNRLRSLKALHTSAATASGELNDIEKRQIEMDKELAVWRAGLEKVESAIKQANETNSKNSTIVETWVKELEGRMAGLGR